MTARLKDDARVDLSLLPLSERGLPAKAVCQSISMLTVLPPSRASRTAAPLAPTVELFTWPR